MKKLLLGLLVLGSISSFADTLDFCTKEYGSLNKGNSLEIINNAYKETGDGNSTRIVCDHPSAGNYLWVNTFKVRGFYRINLEEECHAIIESMKSNPRVGYEFVVENSVVVKVTKSKVKQCDNVGNITSERTILDL